MFDELVADTTGTSGAGAVEAWTRVESAACARRLAAMVTMLDAAYATDGSGAREQWYLDNWGAVSAHLGAAQRITAEAASNLLLIAVGLRDRFPKVQAAFAAGLITYPVARAIVQRGTLVTDPQALHALDAELAEALLSWGPMSVDRTQKSIDAIIDRIDPHAVRRRETQARSRCVDVGVEDASGMAALYACLFATDATALDIRLDALAATVCPADPRIRDQLRSDAMGALAHGNDRLACLCDTEGCPAAELPPSTGVIIHVVAHQDTLTGPPTPTEPPTPEGPEDPADPVPDDPPVPDEGDEGDEEPVSDEADEALAPDAVGSAEGDEADEADEADAPEDCAPADPNTDPAAAECAGLDGLPPPLFPVPLRELTWAQATAPTPERLACIRPAALMGGQFLPGALTRRTALGATIAVIVHPGQAPPEPRYTPSRKLADFVRCRDLTCRFPGCREPATNCDVDHTIAWPAGPTCASNLKSLCRRHHLLKTFWAGDPGWRDRQLRDGTVIWTSPEGRTYLTTPGSRLLFPELCHPTAPVVATSVAATRPTHTAGLRMPRRRSTRTQDRARRIHDERERNRAAAEQAEEAAARAAKQEAVQALPDPDPPPF